MRLMAGRRKNNHLGLEPRVYAKHGAFYYVHRDGRWEKLGIDIGKANERAKLYNDSLGQFGTMAYWLDMFIVDCEARVKAGKLSKRTLEDYVRDIKPLKIGFKDANSPTDIEPNHVQEYLEIGAKDGRPVRANREKACSFGFRDLKGKGATDMWLSGEPIEKIQLLCGHKDKSTTEKYIKQRWRATAAPNMIKITA